MSSNASPRSPPSSTHVALTQLKGHQRPVLCLDYNCGDASFGCLLSGSEDCTARLWDLRVDGGGGDGGDAAKNDTQRSAARIRASLCIKAPSEVVSVAFASSHRGNSTTLTSSFSRDFSVFLSTNDSIREYDLRRAASPLVILPTDDTAFLDADDEVGQVVVSQPKAFAAAVDDAGTLHCWKTNQSHHVLSATVENTMMTTVAIRPHTPKSTQAATGSTDGCIRLWDVGSGRKLKLLDTVDMNVVVNADDAPSTSSSSIQICNPPMVHHVSFSPSGRLLAAALGDGSIAITKVNARGFGTTTRLSDAHGGPVASVVFGGWMRSTAHSHSSSSVHRIDAADRLLCSAGNDGAILYWDLGSSLGGTQQTPQFIEEFRRRLSVGTSDSDGDTQQGSSSTDGDEKPRTLFAIQHGSKPNWMVNSRSTDPHFPSTLFLADTTAVVSAYSIPP